MTQKEFFLAITKNESLSVDMRNHAKESLATIEKRNADRSKKQSETEVANRPLKDLILVALAEKSHTASELAEVLEVSVQKASALCRQMVTSEEILSEDVKIPKKGKQKMYSVLKAETEEVEEEIEEEIEDEIEDEEFFEDEDEEEIEE